MKIFFSGIGGSGVSAIAGFIAEKGHSVVGSDRLFDRHPQHPLCRQLKAQGILIVPQDGNGPTADCDLAVFSTAVEKDNPDFRKAVELGIPMKTRPEYLAELITGFRTIAVAGTSGKSTTSGMLAFLMQRLGMAPNFIGGGRVRQFRTEKNPGNYASDTSDLLVVEACESDGTIIHYKPSYSIISNLALDHHPVHETADMFRILAANTSGLVIAGGDDPNLLQCDLGNPVRFSIDRPSEYQAGDIEYLPFKTAFSLRGQRFGIPQPGRHNVYNTLACISLLSELGVPLGDISQTLATFSGVERRFEIHLNDGKFLVIDDYAHNPHKILSLMQTMQGIGTGVCYIFQPHGYGPTRLMKDEYIRTFGDNLRASDHLVLLPIYYAGGTASQDISSSIIADGVKASGRSAEALKERGMVFDLLNKWSCYVVFGARDDTLSDLARQIAAQLVLMDNG